MIFGSHLGSFVGHLRLLPALSYSRDPQGLRNPPCRGVPNWWALHRGEGPDLVPAQPLPGQAGEGGGHAHLHRHHPGRVLRGPAGGGDNGGALRGAGAQRRKYGFSLRIDVSPSGRFSPRTREFSPGSYRKVRFDHLSHLTKTVHLVLISLQVNTQAPKRILSYSV